jgi:hypothetical protein
MRRIAVLVLVAACGTHAPATPMPTIVETDRFPHAMHTQLACTECHDRAAVAAGVVQIPGSNDHAPCDRNQCHQAAFETTPGPLCRVCHVAVDPTGATPPTMVDYPRTAGWRVMPATFSHAVHLDKTRMEGAVGFHVACSDCHAQGDSDAPSVGGHAECARCHAPEVGLAHAPSMDDCTGCHDATGKEERHRRRTITGDLHFDHRDHVNDARGQSIRCTACHVGVENAAARDDLPAPAIASCVECHDDSRRVPTTMQMRACQTCHDQLSDTIGQLAPRSHLPGTERPVDHTLAFRTDHGEDARKDAQRCATCHTQMSGNTEAACDECHQTMRPADHNVLFRDLDHGTAASTDPERCATCHVVDFCTQCHSQRPRSHDFDWMHEHAARARENVRACLVCHDDTPSTGGTTTSCAESGCHPSGFAP